MPGGTNPTTHLFLEMFTCGMRVTGYEYQDTENELHLRVGLSLRSRQQIIGLPRQALKIITF